MGLMLRSLMVLGLLAAMGCTGEDEERSGDQGQACYPNDTCNAGLLCEDGVCVTPFNAGQQDGSVGDTAPTTPPDDPGPDEGDVGFPLPPEIVESPADTMGGDEPCDSSGSEADAPGAPVPDVPPAESDAGQTGGACTNDSDLAVINDPQNDVEGDASSFGMSCLAETDVTACTAGKLADEHDLTMACSTCFASVFDCIVTSCLTQCAADPDSEECTTCQQEEGCTPDFHACSGLPEDSPQPPDDDPPPQTDFCDLYEETCGDWPGDNPCGDWWAAAPEGSEDDTAGATKGCYSYHLEVAATMTEQEDIDLHCSHAAGAAPCEDEPLVQTDACLNAEDFVVVTDPANEVEEDAAAFGTSCLGDADVTACTTAKLVEKYDLSVSCGACFAGVVECVINHCIAQCVVDSGSNDCACCQMEAGCTPAFHTCSGLPEEAPPTCD